jgi:translocation and assembly module TamB
LRRPVALIALLALLGLGVLARTAAQDSTDGNESGFIVNFLQNQLSGPGREISLSGVSGVLSSEIRIAQITVSDDAGPWMTIDNVALDWSRAALLLRRLSVNALAIERIAVLRRPEPPERSPLDRLPPPEAQPFALPELPVAVQIASIDLAAIEIAEPVLGQAAVLSLTGALELAGGALDTDLALRRTDGPGGSFDLAAAFANDTRLLDLDLRLQEPEGGVVATLLDFEDRPAIDLRLQGAGPLDEVDIDFAFDAGGARIAGGQVALRAADAGQGFDAAFTGELAPVVPAPYRAFFAGETEVAVTGVNKTEGGIRLDRLALRGAALDLGGALETGADGFPRTLRLSGRLGDPAGSPLTLPVPGADTRLTSAILHLDFGVGSRWSGLVALDRLEAGDIAVEDLTLTLGGLAEHLDDPDRRNVTASIEGVATGVWAEDEDIASALGGRYDLFADLALPPGGPLNLRQVQIGGNGLSAFAAGSLEDLVYDGRIALRIAEIAPFSGLAARSLRGGLDLRLDGTISPLEGGFDLALDGLARDLQLDDPRLDRLLAGETTLSGGIARTEAGIRTDDFRLGNEQVEITSSGRFSSTDTDIGFDVRVSDLALVDPRIAGPLSLSGTATGTGRPVRVSLEARVPEGRLLERPIEALSLGFEGSVDGQDIAGTVEGDGRIGEDALTLAADIDLDETSSRLDDLVFALGPNRLSGALERDADGLVRGGLDIAAPDVGALAALALTEARGSLTARAEFLQAEIGQGISLRGAGRGLGFGDTAIERVLFDALVTDAFGRPLVNGDVTADGVLAGGLDVATAHLRADQTDTNRMEVAAEARLAIGTEAGLRGALERLPDGFAATLEALDLRQDAIIARLDAPATVTVTEGNVSLTPLALRLDQGLLTARGEISERFDVDLVVEALPLALANIVRPDLELQGTVDGTARITGPRDAPDIDFDLAAGGLTSAITTAAGLPPVSLTARGETAEGALAFNAELDSGGGLAARAGGSVPLGDGDMAVVVDLESFPLPLVDRLAGGRGLGGTITGQARVAGTPATPQVEFDLQGAGITADALRDTGVAPVGVTLAGSFADGTVALGSGRLTNPQGIDLTVSGRAPLAGPGLDLRAGGTLPLALANTLLAERSAQASGLITLDLTAQGALSAPVLGGSARLAGGTIVDPETNIRLEDIAIDARLEGRDVVISQARADVASGGRIEIAGRASTDAAAGHPADLTARFIDVRYTDGSFVTTRLDGELTVQGPLVGGGGQLRGNIDLGPTEISVAEGFGGPSQVALEDVIHRLPPPTSAGDARPRASRGAQSAPGNGAQRPRRGRAHPGSQPDLRARPRARCRARRRIAGHGRHHRSRAGRPV